MHHAGSRSKHPLLAPAYDISEYVSVSRISTILLMEDISMLFLPESQAGLASERSNHDLYVTSVDMYLERYDIVSRGTISTHKQNKRATRSSRL